jgi:hypothetical protein
VIAAPLPIKTNNINALIHITGRFILHSPWIALAVFGVLLIVFGVTWIVFPLA